MKFFIKFAFTKAWLISICLLVISISNASPIQFWLTGQYSFNNKEECSIYSVCFCQTIDPSDTLRLDIGDPLDGTNHLKVYKDDGSLWSTFNFTATGINHHQYLTITNWSAVDDRRLIFKITDNSSNILAVSDCVEITNNQDFTCTKLITYSNSSDIAGLQFTSTSPSTVYYLRIPAVFFEEQYPQEQEDLELSTYEIVTLWSKMEGKKLLDIGFMPFYMHKKVQLILMMDNVTIDGIEYRKRDEYQIAQGAKKFPLKRAQVLLSEKDFIIRNLL